MTQHPMASRSRHPGTGGWLQQRDAARKQSAEGRATSGCSSPDCDYCRQVRLMMRAPQKPQGFVPTPAFSLIARGGGQ